MLSLRNPRSGFEKDVFKVILAKENGLPLCKLILIGKKGAVKWVSAPGLAAIGEWVFRRHGIKIEIAELT